MYRVVLSILVICLALTACGGQATGLTREQVLEARKLFVVEVVSFDGMQGYGLTSLPSDYVRLRITNNSSITLPCLTVLTKRYDARGRMVGIARKPPIPTSNLKPGESAEYDYYPLGRITDAVKITVEVEHLIKEDDMRFFDELN